MEDGDAAKAAQEARSRRAPQNRQARDNQRAKYDDHLAAISQIEWDAGPTLRGELGRSKRVQAAYKINQDRAAFVQRRLGQRSGLLRLLRAELGADPVFDDRSRIFVRQMLMLSANVTAVTGSSWKSSLSWFHSCLPAFTGQMSAVMESDFDRYVEDAQIELAKRASAGDPNQLTGPSPSEIAETLGTTTVQLRLARANTCGLTSIDPPDPKVRDRERKAEARSKAGSKKQIERTSKAELKALAERLGCSLATLYRKRLDGTFDAYVAAHDQDETNVSGVGKEIDGGHFGLTPANDDEKVARTA